MGSAAACPDAAAVSCNLRAYPDRELAAKKHHKRFSRLKGVG